MQSLDHEELSIHIDAPPGTVYAIVADVARTPEYSPEIVECRWLDGATGPAPGVRFKARNRVGRISWSNKPMVTVAEPGREFAFSRTEPLCGTLQWRYRFEPEDGGTRVTQSYLVVRPITRLGWIIVSGFGTDRNRARTMRDGMELSLQRLRTVAERDQADRSGGR
ncbi:SRPBCC family protein [Arthrobacter sp. I2-34]|uniref:SRPBCC family protein n=1 Tax=Arthrobacter hankyongi TaxID=2904801 RepID=A0ABS9L2S4_9MICC|nr:SRPBCC family protein [Arthrobacter hankyongi]MCG2620948.1 SRPBCC family protein [Arthrobacter hankyongi]